MTTQTFNLYVLLDRFGTMMPRMAKHEAHVEEPPPPEPSMNGTNGVHEPSEETATVAR